MTKQTKRLTITKKVFTKADILRIAQIFSDESETSRQSQHCSLSLQVSCTDGTSYESESMKLLEDEIPLGIKKSDSIQMTFYNFELEKHMDLSLHEGRVHLNRLMVQGCDSNWVSATFARLTEVIDSVKPQDNWILRHKKLCLHLTALGIGTVILQLLFLLLSDDPQSVSNLFGASRFWEPIADSDSINPWLVYSFLWFSRWYVGLIPAFFIREWLLSLWPDVEFDFGPEHLRVHRTGRKRLSKVLYIVVIPLVLEILADILGIVGL